MADGTLVRCNVNVEECTLHDRYICLSSLHMINMHMSFKHICMFVVVDYDKVPPNECKHLACQRKS